MKVIFGARLAREPALSELGRLEGIELVATEGIAEAIPHLPGADALVIADPQPEEGAALAEALRRPDSTVQWIQIVSAGFEGLVAHGIPPGLRVTNQGGAVAPAVAEHGMALILAMARRLDHILDGTRRGVWDRDFRPPIFSLEGRRLAIVGYGNVGRQLARRAKAFDMAVTGLSRSAKSDALADEVLPMSAFHETLGRADVVAVTAALSPQTRHLMDAAAFAALKEGALLVNLSRGETVDPAALRAALVGGRLRGAAIDVTEPEPLPEGDPLWSAPNLIVSPHTAGAGSPFAAQRIAAVTVENVERFRSGRPLIHQVA